LYEKRLIEAQFAGDIKRNLWTRRLNAQPLWGNRSLRATCSFASVEVASRRASSQLARSNG